MTVRELNFPSFKKLLADISAGLVDDAGSSTFNRQGSRAGKDLARVGRQRGDQNNEGVR